MAVNARFVPAPNKYRKIFAEHPKPDAAYWAEREASRAMQAAEWPEGARRARGLELSLGFEPILVWDGAAEVPGVETGGMD